MACLNGGRTREEHPAVPQTAAELAANLFDLHLADVPFREDDERRAVRLARGVGDVEVLIDDALRRIDQHEGDVGALGRFERAELGVVVDALAVAALAPLPAPTWAPLRAAGALGAAPTPRSAPTSRAAP